MCTPYNNMTGQDRTGQDRTGQDRTGHLCAPEDQITVRELYSFIRSSVPESITAYDGDIDPIHYFIFTATDKDKNILEDFIHGRRLEGKYPSGRIICVIQPGKLICRRWSDDIFRRAHTSGNGIRTLAREDCKFMFMVLSLTKQRAQCWIRGKLIYSIEGDYSDDKLYDELFRYMKASRYRLNILCVGHSIKYFMKHYVKYIRFSFMDAVKLVYLFVKRKAGKMIRSAEVRVKYRDSVHTRRNTEKYQQDSVKYIEFVNRKLSLHGHYTILMKDYMTAEIAGEQVFIKGHEFKPKTLFLPNEIRAQKKLLALSREDRELFVCMKDFYDGEYTFIVFPYAPQKTIMAYYADGNRLTREGLDELGEFFIRVLDVFYENGIVHRDLHFNNIVYIPENREGCRFKIIDFGVSFSGNPDILGSNGHWDKEIKTYWIGGGGKYDDNITDDAATLWHTYIVCGGSPTDRYAEKIQSLIGRMYTYEE